MEEGCQTARSRPKWRSDSAGQGWSGGGQRSVLQTASGPPRTPTLAGLSQPVWPERLGLRGRIAPILTKPLGRCPDSHDCPPEMWLRKEPATYRSGPRDPVTCNSLEVSEKEKKKKNAS